MKKNLTPLLLLLSLCSVAQIKTQDAIVKEGKQLYASEMASWYGTDIFLEKFKDKMEIVGGYFSYIDNGMPTCVFFSNSGSPKILATIVFDSTYNTRIAKINTDERDFSRWEYDLYTIRQIALSEIKRDTLFRVYNDTDLNLIPVSDEKGKRVFALTGTQKHKVVIFGNDYLLTFDKTNRLTSKKRIHKNIIPIDFAQADNTESLVAMHTHSPETGDLITSTDICTLLLYEKIAKWTQHYVMSDKNVSIWDCEKNRLIIISTAAWNTINKIQKDAGK